MSDISKCEGTDCPLKKKCHRFTAKADKFGQSYFSEVPFKDGKCEYFWDNSNRLKYDKNHLVSNPFILID